MVEYRRINDDSDQGERRVARQPSYRECAPMDGHRLVGVEVRVATRRKYPNFVFWEKGTQLDAAFVDCR